jgi:hypothetical protein
MGIETGWQKAEGRGLKKISNFQALYLMEPTIGSSRFIRITDHRVVNKTMRSNKGIEQASITK